MDSVYSAELCAEKHKHIEDRLDKNDSQIDTLVKSDAVNTTNIKLLLKAVWGMFGTVVVTLLGFLVWYIQTI
jgi:hypothetical protein